ncbi:MAG: 4-carboxy-4-hydroxy-2-oxoadipate aldolase/oxaloacetate decarboxylase [Acidimicrobiia bacterium]|nr:4-carboxy-4-hydroxy-2-oxoadipate aldolase/oxaloacetate decarboxylase [Acidimicrobiia bacterium]
MSRRHLVVRDIPRTELEIVDRFPSLGVATIHEAQGRTGSIAPNIQAIQRGASVAGNAVTVLSHPGDNMMIHAAIEVCREGDILVVTNDGPSTHGMFGELLATSLRTRGVRGLVIDAGVRDVAELRTMGFPVWTRHVSPLGTEKETPGSVNVPVTIGGVTVRPGDLVCADDDGVVIVPRETVDDCLAASEERLEREKEKRTRLAAGELTLDMDGIREKLTRLGVEFVDRAPDE